MRFMAAEQRLVRQRQEFEYRWNETRIAVADPPTDDEIVGLLSLGRENVLAVQDIIAGETGDWLTDFRGALADAERRLVSTHQP